MYETVPVKAARVFYTAGCCLFFQKQTGTKYYMEQCETCMMSDVVWYKNNPSESEITHETACQAWLFMIKGEA